MTLSASESAELVRLMAKVKFPAEENIFFAWLRHFYANATELAFLYQEGDSTHILLTKRKALDPYYPDMWHMPGSIQLQDETFPQVIRRCITSELGASAVHLADRATLCHYWNDLDKVRGQVNQFLFVIKLRVDDGRLLKLNGHRFFSVTDLPQPIIASHTVMIDHLRTSLLAHL